MTTPAETFEIFQSFITFDSIGHDPAYARGLAEGLAAATDYPDPDPVVEGLLKWSEYVNNRKEGEGFAQWEVELLEGPFFPLDN